MEPLLRFDLEAHDTGATLYLTGALSMSGARTALSAAEQLPGRVRALRVDMRGIVLIDPDAFHLLALRLRDWRAARAGITRIRLPKSRWPAFHVPVTRAS